MKPQIHVVVVGVYAIARAIEGDLDLSALKKQPDTINIRIIKAIGLNLFGFWCVCVCSQGIWSCAALDNNGSVCSAIECVRERLALLLIYCNEIP